MSSIFIFEDISSIHKIQPQPYIYGCGCILWQEFDHQLLDVGLEVCGRAGQDLAKQDISCVNIQIFLLEPSHSGEAEKLKTFISHFEIRHPCIVCFQRQIYLVEQIDLSSVLDKHVDKMFS